MAETVAGVRGKDWGLLALGGLAVYIWMKSNAMPLGSGGTGGRIGAAPNIQLPNFVPCVIDPITGDCVMQETPMPGSALPGVPDINPAQTPGGDPGFTPILQDPLPGGGGALPVVSGQPGTPGGPVLLTP